ncbi:hypothetical protein N7468_001713 [Penicillium chermesinum]|uniref:Uncharacterized protein n=1 Tax=Penicillium chermesinum TaxID=63820 RepID=A0A9W9TX03_9EURO|nr:uncharacterized protein N7468_001713 [Penicillium chermesinum]KAJ5246730.1 hypothetical protein N7468_001713 [Penicillium chermesinum]
MLRWEQCNRDLTIATSLLEGRESPDGNKNTVSERVQEEPGALSVVARAKLANVMGAKSPFVVFEMHQGECA